MCRRRGDGLSSVSLANSRRGSSGERSSAGRAIAPLSRTGAAGSTMPLGEPAARNAGRLSLVLRRRTAGPAQGSRMPTSATCCSLCFESIGPTASRATRGLLSMAREVSSPPPNALVGALAGHAVSEFEVRSRRAGPTSSSRSNFGASARAHCAGRRRTSSGGLVRLGSCRRSTRGTARGRGQGISDCHRMGCASVDMPMSRRCREQSQWFTWRRLAVFHHRRIAGIVERPLILSPSAETVVGMTRQGRETCARAA